MTMMAAVETIRCIERGKLKRSNDNDDDHDDNETVEDEGEARRARALFTGSDYVQRSALIR